MATSSERVFSVLMEFLYTRKKKELFLEIFRQRKSKYLRSLVKEGSSSIYRGRKAVRTRNSSERLSFLSDGTRVGQPNVQLIGQLSDIIISSAVISRYSEDAK